MSVKVSKIAQAVGMMVTWIAVILQLYLIMLNRTVSAIETFIRFLEFFTILTNISVAVCFTYLLFGREPELHFFSKKNNMAAITVYICVVGLIYNLILRSLWMPTGLQRIVDETLHTVIPLYFLFYWVSFGRKAGIDWKNAVGWLIFPLAYMIIVFLYGAGSGYYPYPFMNVTVLGFGKVVGNSGLVCLVFLLFSFIVISIAKISQRATINRPHS